MKGRKKKWLPKLGQKFNAVVIREGIDYGKPAVINCPFTAAFSVVQGVYFSDADGLKRFFKKEYWRFYPV